MKYSVDELAEIAQLSDTQLERLQTYELLPGLRPHALGSPDEIASLRLWGAADSGQRFLLETAGLPFDSLSPAQLAAFDGADGISVADEGSITAKVNGDRTVAFAYWWRKDKEEYSVDLSPIPYPFRNPKLSKSLLVEEMNWYTDCPMPIEDRSTLATRLPQGK